MIVEIIELFKDIIREVGAKGIVTIAIISAVWSAHDFARDLHEIEDMESYDNRVNAREKSFTTLKVRLMILFVIILMASVI